MPILTLVMAYAVDYGYFFMVAADLTSAARGAAEYCIQGYQGPAQNSLPTAGPMATVTSVASLAAADINLFNASNTTTVQVCSKSIGMTGNLPKCSSFGPAGSTYTPVADPEAPTFVLQRVDVTYTVRPPVPVTFFSVSLIPIMQFHRQVSMRVMD